MEELGVTFRDSNNNKSTVSHAPYRGDHYKDSDRDSISIGPADTSHGPVSVCLSQVGGSIETAERIQLVLAWELPSAHLTLC